MNDAISYHKINFIGIKLNFCSATVRSDFTLSYSFNSFSINTRYFMICINCAISSKIKFIWQLTCCRRTHCWPHCIILHHSDRNEIRIVKDLSAFTPYTPVNLNILRHTIFLTYALHGSEIIFRVFMNLEKLNLFPNSHP